jgi:hypothetical protein
VSPVINDLLTIVIPTRNRSNQVEKLVKELLSLIELNDLIDVKIVVSDNSSDHKTQIVINNLLDNSPNILRLVTQIKQHETTEEHMSELLETSNSEWTLFFSDETKIIEENFVKLINYLREQKNMDYLILDYIIHESGGLIKQYYGDVRTLGQMREYLDLIQNHGFYNGVTVIGSIIYKTKSLNINKYKEILESGKIFSHIAFNIACLENKNGEIFELPIFKHKTTIEVDLDYSNWLIYGQRKKRPVLDPWMLNFYKLLDYLLENKHIDSNFIFESISHEITKDQFQFAVPLTQNMYNVIIRNIVFENKRYGLAYSDKDRSEMKRILRKFKGTNELINTLESNDLSLINNSNDTNHYFQYFYATFLNYSIFCVQNKFIAVKSSNISAISSFIYSREYHGHNCIIDYDIDKLKTRIQSIHESHYEPMVNNVIQIEDKHNWLFFSRSTLKFLSVLARIKNNVFGFPKKFKKHFVG